MIHQINFQSFEYYGFDKASRHWVRMSNPRHIIVALRKKRKMLFSKKPDEARFNLRTGVQERTVKEGATNGNNQ